MKKLLFVNGSNNKFSVTGKIGMEILKGLKNEYIVNDIMLSKHNIDYCIGCECCFKKGKCSIDHKDKFYNIRDELKKSDILIFASPVYEHSVSGKMKSFFDRLAVYCHTLELSGKLGIALVSTANSGEHIVSSYIKNIQQSMGIKNILTLEFNMSIDNLDDFISESIEQIKEKLNNNYGYSNVHLENLYERINYLYLKKSKEKIVYNNMNYYEWKYWNDINNVRTKDFIEFALNIDRGRLKKDYVEYIKFNSEEIHNNKIIININDTLNFIVNDFKHFTIPSKYYGDIVIFLASVLEITNNNEELVYIAYKLIYEIKCMIDSNSEMISLGMFEELGKYAFGINLFSKKTKMLENLAKSINELLLDKVVRLVNNINGIGDSTKASNYDVISGVSGILNYFLEETNYGVENKKIIILIEYLIKLASTNIDVSGRRHINFHISRENQNREDEKKFFLNGNINFGLAHGMIGPLLVLSKAYKLGFKNDSVVNAINRILEIYKEYHVDIEDLQFWPGQMDYMYYRENMVISDNNVLKVPSWCYGNIGISNSLMQVYANLGNNNKRRYYEKLLVKIAARNIENDDNFSHSLCHGYSSILSVITSIDSFNPEIMEKIVDIIVDRHKLINKEEDLNSNRDCERHILNYSILEGVLGVSLSLLSVIYDNCSYKKLMLIE